MNIEKYKIMYMISQNKKLSEIAVELNISQPTVSFHLKSLEKELGLKLFDTYNKTICLTSTAKQLLPYVTEILSLDSALHEKANHFQKSSIDIKIGSTLSPCLTILPELISDYTLDHPNNHIRIEVASAKIIMEHILNYRYDLGLLSTNDSIPDQLASHKLFIDQLIFVFPIQYKELFETDPYVKFISQMNFIHHTENSSTRQAAEQLLYELKLHPKSLITVNSTEVIKELISKNAGISILPYSLVQSEIKQNQLGFKPIHSLHAEKYVHLIYHKKHILTPELTEFIQQIILKSSTSLFELEYTNIISS